MAAPVRFRRSRHVVGSWRGAVVTLRNYALGTRTFGPGDVCAILAACEEWQPLEAIAATTPHLRLPEVRSLVSRLVQASMMHRSDRKEPAAERAMARLTPWNPEAGLFHSATKDVRFGPRLFAERALDERMKGKKPPRSVKRFAGAVVRPLPKLPRDGEFADVLLARRTWRRFTSDPLPIDELALLLDLTAGIQQWAIDSSGTRAPRKTSPSGGARHPIDVYVVALRVKGLAKGLYHYAADRHRLDRLRRGVPAGGVLRYLPQQDWYAGAAAMLLFCASFERLLFRYHYARAYRAALIEAGHLCQTFCLTATWRGLAPFCSIALADSVIERDLGLDGVSESVLYAAGVGVPDGQVESGTAPRDASPLRFLRNSAFTRKPAPRR